MMSSSTTNTLTVSSSTTPLTNFLLTIRGTGRKRRASETKLDLPAPKRKRHLSTGDQSTEPPTLVYRELEHYTSKYPRFKTYNHVTKFVIRSVSGDPEGDLQHIFGNLIKKAKKNTPGGVSMYNVLIYADGLDTPIAIPMRPPEQNSPEAIVHKIAKVGKSADAINLLNAAMTVLITTVKLPEGAGGMRKRHFDPLDHFGGLNDDYRIRSLNSDNNNYCMFIALELARLSHDDAIGQQYRLQKKTPDRKLLYRRGFQTLASSSDKQTDLAISLMREAKIPTNLNAYDIKWLETVQSYYDRKFPGLYRIVAFDDEERTNPIWFWPDHRRQHNVAIYLEQGHWDGIRKIEGFFRLTEKREKFCVDCATKYINSTSHNQSCPARCRFCGKIGPEYPCTVQEGFYQRCLKCHHLFENRKCFENHRKTGQCYQFRYCYKCKKSYNFVKGHRHNCDEPHCFTCHTFHNPKRGCYIEQLRPENPMPTYRILAFDFESTQDTPSDVKEAFEHRVNYVAAKWTCTECNGDDNEDCQICTENDPDNFTRIRTWSALDGCANPLRSFVRWVLTAFPSKFPTLAFAHAGGHYDHHFVLQELCKLTLQPEVTINGCKIYQISTKCNKLFNRVIFRDSFRLTHSALDALPKMFGLDCTPKLFFPHLFNKKTNYDIVLPTLPDQEYYCYESMKEEKYQAFKKWHNDNYNTPFALKEQLGIYCKNDVEILMQTLVKLRNLIIEITSKGRMQQINEKTNEIEIVPTTMDVMYKSQTIASVCMNIYRRMFVPPLQIPIVPEKGYERHWRQSPDAIKFLEFLEAKSGRKVMHAGNGEEKCFVVNGSRYFVDGYDEDWHCAIEICGCYVHGCLKCYHPSAEMINKQSAEECNQQQKERRKILESIVDKDGRKLDVVEVWECEIKKWKDEFFIEKDGERQSMKEFFEDRPSKGQINPREAYAGGRTGPSRMFAKAEDDWEINMADIISLYPYINFSTAYPTGIPEIIIPPDFHVNWQRQSDLKYLGLYKARVIPPKQLFLPVLPFRTDDRLLFPLCAKCAKANKKETPICKHHETHKCKHKCTHDDIDRSWVGVFTHLELRKALEKGYRVDMCYRVWHWANEMWNDGLFKDYVRLFLCLKIEASGWPSDEFEGNIKLQEEFIRTYKQRYGIQIQAQNMKSNPGMRTLSKLALNSLWGKFSMKNDYTSSDIVKTPSKFYNILLDHKREVTMVVPMNEECLRVVHRQKEDFVEEHSCSNIIFSLWTTSAARMHLYNYMEQIENAENCSLLYTDTDSVIYRHKKGENPLQPGEFLGQMAMEYKGFRIVEFCSAGSKQYGLKMQSETDPSIYKHVLKLRGITLDQRTVEHHNFRYEKFKHMVENYGNKDEVHLQYRRINPDRASCITSFEQIKRYAPVCKKGILCVKDKNDMTIFPFGYVF